VGQLSVGDLGQNYSGANKIIPVKELAKAALLFDAIGRWA
jgi:hypothetical protein